MFCLVFVAPCLVIGSTFLPWEWAQEEPVLLGFVLSAVALAVLFVTFGVTRALLVWSRPVLRIEGDELEVARWKGRKRDAVARLDDVVIHPGKYVTDSRSGGVAVPALAVDVPGYEEFTLAVDDPELRWVEEGRELSEIQYIISSLQWRRLVRALGLEQRVESYAE